MILIFVVKHCKKYHQLLWSKRLPNGEMMDLIIGNSYNYCLGKIFDLVVTLLQQVFDTSVIEI